MPVQIPTLDEIRAVVREEIRAALSAVTPAADLPLDSRRAAQLAGVSPKTIRNWVAKGRLRATRRGRSLRIERSDLARAMAGDSPDPRTAAAKILARLEQPSRRRSAGAAPATSRRKTP
ncbi:MAG: helix-turn-helix domain-containing protein [Anaeromyxobacteraceae bacterium]